MLSRLRLTRAPAAPPTTPPLETLQSLLSSSAPSDPCNFLTEGTLVRYLRACTNNPHQAHTMLLSTLSWRASYQPHLLQHTHTSTLHSQAQTAKLFVCPHTDRHGRAIILMRPGLENSTDASARLRFLVYTLERASRLAGDDGKFVVVVDYTAGKVCMANMPGIGLMKQVAHVLQAHYPERLALAMFVDAPRIFLTSFRIVSPLLENVTREKIVFCEKHEWVDKVGKEYVPMDMGGQCEFEFKLDKYFEETERKVET